jgi:hypothetical protein
MSLRHESAVAAAQNQIFELRASLELLSQPAGLSASSCPFVALLVAIFDRHFSAFQRASSSRPANGAFPVSPQPRKLVLQLNRLLTENLSDFLAKLQKRLD